MRSMQQQLGVLGTISAFACRHSETKKNLCRGDRNLCRGVSNLTECIKLNKTKCEDTAVIRQWSSKPYLKIREQNGKKHAASC